MIRLIASDLDGTLLVEHAAIHPDNLTAIRRAQAMGVRFAVASGRSVASCALILRDAGLEDVSIIGVNGCHVVDREGGQTLAVRHLPGDAARRTMEIFAAHGLEGCLYTEDALVYTNENALDAENGYEQASFIRRMAKEGVTIAAGREAVLRALDTTPMKAYCFYTDEAQLEDFARARTACAAIEGVELTSSWHTNFEVMPAGVDKGVALERLAGHLGIDRAQVMAFGDNENDLPMLHWAGMGVAMANAVPTVLAQIGQQTQSCAEGGVARHIARVLWPDDVKTR